MEQFGEVFEILTKDMDNKMCIDCKKPYPLFASINNGVFLCESCSEVHKAMGPNISYIRHLKDSWDEYLLSYMRRGGNRRFNQILEEYEVMEDSSIAYKYFTKAIENYRLTLRSEVLAEEPPEKLPKSEGNLISNNSEINHYPEFGNYHLMGEGVNMVDDEEENFSDKKNFLDKVGLFFKKVGKNVEKAAVKVSDKIKELEIGDKLKATGTKAYVVIKKAGGFVVQKSKLVKEKFKEKTKEGFDIITDKAKEGANKISVKTMELYSEIKFKITGKQDPFIIGVNGEPHVSDYYELKSTKDPTANDSITNFIDENNNNPVPIDKKEENDNNQIPVEKKEENLNLSLRNSFTLLNNDSIVQEEGI